MNLNGNGKNLVLQPNFNKEQSWRTFPDFKILQSRQSFWHRDRHIDRWTVIEDEEIDLHIDDFFISDKVQTKYHAGKIVSFTTGKRGGI